MSKANMACHTCGIKGHLAAECPTAAYLGDDKRSPWCGFCDEITRLIDAGDIVARCQVCHPLRHQQLRQHRKCPHCKATVYEYDHNPCGSHAGPHIPDKRPDREHVHAIIEMENAR